ncbi:MAG: RsmE family RNA methyltransferase [Pseudomonadota bacterium]
MRRFFIPSHNLSGDNPVITGDDAGHIRNVLRLKPGDEIELIDGTGLECDARIVGISAGKVEVSILGRRLSESQSFPRLIIAQALLKDNKPDTIIRQITELGIHEWVPFAAHRSVPVLNAQRISARKDRWEKIAIEALKQCRRSNLLNISDLLTFDAMLTFGQDCDIKLIFWEDESPSRPFELPEGNAGSTQSVIAIIGPEGGFTPEEIAAARARGYTTVSLGPRILKADTATLAVSTLLQYGYGDMRLLKPFAPPFQTDNQ